MAFTPRLECPAATEKWWLTSYNRCIERLYGTVLPNCTGYAWGRFSEIMGEMCNLPTSNAGLWYRDVGNRYEKGSTPRLGAVLCLSSNSGGAGHVAIVEQIHSDGSITLSNSGYSCSWSGRFFTCDQNPPNYYWSGYSFQGFIYNPAVDANETSTLSLDSAEHPANRFIAELESHVGSAGHAWVQSMTSIGNGAWCAATMCAGAKATGLAGVCMPSDNYLARGFGADVVDTYGGQYFEGPKQGSVFTPQVGDLILFKSGSAGPREAGHIEAVRYVSDGKVYTVGGNTGSGANTGSGEFLLCEYKIDSTYINWYARPNWNLAGGSNVVNTTLVGGGELYTTRSSRADASMREVCYLNGSDRILTPTDCRLSVLNYTSQLADLVRLAGGITQEMSLDGANDDVSGLTDIQQEIVAFFKNKGLNTAACIGILANIQAESNFNTSAVGDYGTSFGICQWHNERGLAMIAIAGSNWSTNLTGQLNYLWHELSTSYKSSVLDPIKQVANTLEGAKQAADIFVRKFEVPANVDQQSQIRQQYAEELWGKIIVNPAGSSGTVVQASSVIQSQSGLVLNTGTAVEVPSSVSQTGIIANYTSYTQFYGQWSRGTNQRKLSEVWADSGKMSTNSICIISGYYLIALSPIFGKCGDMVTVHLEDGSFFNAIIADEKGNDASSLYGHVFIGVGVDIVEWEAYGSSQSNLENGLRSAGFYGKKVSKIVNYGTYFQ